MSKPRGWWNTSFRDKAVARYNAHAIVEAQQAAQGSQEPYERGYKDGWQAGREALLRELEQGGSAHNL